MVQYRQGNTGICPWCGKETRFVQLKTPQNPFRTPYRPVPFEQTVIISPHQNLRVDGSQCTLCEKIIIWFSGIPGDGAVFNCRVWPLGHPRPVAEEVPEFITQIHQRATRQLGFDDTACAAFSRTCLEKVLDDQKVPKKRNLEERITTFVTTHSISTGLSKNIDLIRSMGNFIHLNESLFTGEIVDISTEEAGFVIDVLDSLFEELYVAPKRQEGLRQRIDEKLKDTGKK